jgi:hypothetical protein
MRDLKKEPECFFFCVCVCDLLYSLKSLSLLWNCGQCRNRYFAFCLIKINVFWDVMPRNMVKGIDIS